MSRHRVLPEEARLELLDGEVVEMEPIGAPHASITARLTRWIVPRAGDEAFVWVANPVILDDHTLVVPDLCLLRSRSDDYAIALPTADDVLLAVEVADSSERKDRQIKRPLYARAGVPELWIALVRRGKVEVCRDPRPADARYDSVEIVGLNDSITVETRSRINVPVNQWMG
jgi:Uma2 family endonuclease